MLAEEDGGSLCFAKYRSACGWWLEWFIVVAGVDGRFIVAKVDSRC